MTELSKEAKLILFIDAITGFIFAFLMLVIPEVYFEISDWKEFCPGSVRQVGTIFLILSIFFLLAVKRNDFEQIKIAWEIGIAWLIAMAVVNIVNVMDSMGTPLGRATGMFNIILGIKFST